MSRHFFSTCNFLDFLQNQNFDAEIEMNEFSTEPSSKDERFPVEFVMEEIRPLVTRKYEFEYWDKPIVEKLLHPLDDQRVDWRINTNNLFFDFSTTTLKLLIDIFIEEVENVVAKQYDCLFRNSSLLSKLLWFFGFSHFWYNYQISVFFIKSSKQSCIFWVKS